MFAAARHHRPLTPLCQTLLPFAACCLFIACAPTRQSPSTIEHSSQGDILQRSAAAHQRLQSLYAAGLLRDYRQGARRIVPIEWRLARPNRCRLQIDMDLAIVSADDWWTYQAQAGRFRTHRTFTRTPIETAAQLLSDGINFYLPALFERGPEVLGRSGDRAARDWLLQGAAWSGDRPCFVFTRPPRLPAQSTFLRLWIDQDSLLIRGWMQGEVREDGREKTIIECTYYVLRPDERLPSDAFQLKPPNPIVLPDSAAAVAP